MKRGDVCWAELLPRSGSEQQGRRPVVVISHDGFNQTPTWKSIIVIPISTAEGQLRRGPTVVPLPTGAGGLPRPSVALCHQVTTLDRTKLQQRLGTLTTADLEQVIRALFIAVGAISDP